MPLNLPPDLLDMLMGAQVPTAEEKQRALAQAMAPQGGQPQVAPQQPMALAQQQAQAAAMMPPGQQGVTPASQQGDQLGLLAMLSGDPVLGQVGQAINQDRRAQQQFQVEQGRLREAMAQNQQQTAYQNKSLELQQKRLDQGNWTIKEVGDPNDPKKTRFVKVNEDTGEIRQTPYGGKPGGGLSGVAGERLSAALSHRMIQDLDEEHWKGPAAAQVAGRDQAKHMLKLVYDSGGDITNLSAPEQEELALGFARIIKGGQATEHEARSLVPPQTLQSGAAGIKEWLLNEPQGRNQQEFTRRMAHSVERQRDVSQSIIDQTKAKNVGGHRKLKELDPEQWEANVIAYDMDPANFDEKGVYKLPPPAEAKPQPQVSAQQRMAQIAAANPSLSPEDILKAYKEEKKRGGQ